MLLRRFHEMLKLTIIIIIIIIITSVKVWIEFLIDNWPTGQLWPD